MQNWILQLHEQPVLNDSVCSWRFHNSAFRLEAPPQKPTDLIRHSTNRPHATSIAAYMMKDWASQIKKQNSKNTCEKNDIPNQGFQK